ncbi:MAG: hypothetical protein ACI91G_000518 [Gammaproteobacteria bacterium]|jgi:hypothetical protein
MSSNKPYRNLTSFSQHLSTDQKLSELRNDLGKPRFAGKERGIIQQLLPNLNETVQIICSYSVGRKLILRTDSPGVASRLRFILPQLAAALHLRSAQEIKVICRPIEAATDLSYWQATTGSVESGNILMRAAASAEQSTNTELAVALRRLAATIARED